MKKYLLHAVAALLTGVLCAQQIQPDRQYLIDEFAQSVKGLPDAKSRIGAFANFINAGAQSQRGTDALDQRIIGYREDNYTNGLLQAVDSNTWNYGANRGSASVNNALYNERRRYVLADSIVPDYLYIRTWDTLNRNIELREKDWVNNSFTDKNRTLYAYDAAGNRTNITSQTWTGLAWKYTTRSVFTFNNNHQQLIETVSEWQDTVWVQLYRYSYAYDANAYLSEELYQEFNGSTFENGFHMVYTNAPNGDRLTELHRNWVAGAWVNDIRFTFTYDGQHHQLSSILERWVSGAWTNEDKVEYTYHSSGNFLSDISYAWNGAMWDTIKKKYFVVTGNYVTEDSTQLFSGGSWQNAYRTSYTYDAAMNPDVVTFFTWGSGNWQNDKRSDYDYNNVNFKLDHQLKQQWYSSAWQTDVERFYYYEDYEALPTGFIALVNAPLKLAVYPNPAYAVLNVDYATATAGNGMLCVYNANGQETLATPLQFNRGDNYLPLSISNLPAGFYVLELQSTEGAVRTKFYKQ